MVSCTLMRALLQCLSCRRGEESDWLTSRSECVIDSQMRRRGMDALRALPSSPSYPSIHHFTSSLPPPRSLLITTTTTQRSSFSNPVAPHPHRDVIPPCRPLRLSERVQPSKGARPVSLPSTLTSPHLYLASFSSSHSHHLFPSSFASPHHQRMGASLGPPHSNVARKGLQVGETYRPPRAYFPGGGGRGDCLC